MTLPQGTILRGVMTVAPAAGVPAIYNSFHARLEAVGGLSEADAITQWTAWITALFNTYKAAVPSTNSLNKLALYEVGGTTYFPPVALSVAGTGSGDAYATGCALLVLGFTSRAKSVARKYLGPLTEAAMAGNAIPAGTLTYMTNFRAAWLATFGGGSANNWRPGIYSYERDEFLALVTTSNVPYARYQTRRRAR